MSQQFTIQSESIRDKLNTLLPSQNLGAIGVELTGSTQIVPIVDLTEVAEGSSLRQDLQTAQDFAIQQNSITNATNTVFITTTGFFKLDVIVTRDTSGANGTELNIFDGTTSKPIFTTNSRQGGTGTENVIFKTIIYLRAGDSLRGTANPFAQLQVYSRQIADIAGNLTNPLGFV
mgnify:CR=1 FL=1